MKRRRSIRFRPEQTTVAELRGVYPGPLTHLSVVRDESYRGCSLIVQKAAGLQAGAFCRVKVGHLEEMPARVAWVSDLNGEFVKAGFEYLG